MIRRILLTLLVLLGLTALWLFVVAMHWLPPLSDAERARLALMRDDSGARDPRGWARAWVTGFEVPESGRDAWLADPPDDLPERVEAYPPRRAPALAMEHCGTDRRACLAGVAADAEAMREALAGSAAFSAAVAELESIDGVHDPVPGALRDAMPLWAQAGAQVRAEVALAFHQGERAAAAERLCASAAWWRGLRQDASSLVINLMPMRHLADHGSLLAEMLAADPALAVPAACDAAFAAPTAGELSLCEAVRGEFRRMEAWHREPPVPEDGWEQLAFRLVNLEHTLAVAAEAFAHHCEAPAAEALLAGRVPANPPDAGECGAGGWAFNPMGCMLAPVVAGFYDSYAKRVIDFARRQRLVASAIWLHREADGDAAAAFARRPEALRDPEARLVSADEAGPARIEVGLIDSRREPTYALPLPAAALPDDGATPENSAPE